MFSVSSSLCKIYRSFYGSVFGDGLVKIGRSSGSAGRERVTADFFCFFQVAASSSALAGDES
jgi:hypothetical protein